MIVHHHRSSIKMMLWVGTSTSSSVIRHTVLISSLCFLVVAVAVAIEARFASLMPVRM